ncbi:hypothetical protein IHE55_13780 [Streptomyces pactum]|uniref:Nuclear transport factor 2 family protein n=1 Tax=Streptomyces pactum TaxID=68249 RepID=A0ABS0NKX6_9ACTN|nr:hypothetical protein [Streptomyces pactum]MBH5335806.1 hypothetical protein [Streptomyces pactum]
MTDRLRAEVERLEVRSVELLGDSRARVVIGYGEYMETTLTRRGDRWLVAATERARP